MDERNLYQDNIYGNGYPTYYIDDKCEKTYTGHVEIYYKGLLSEEFDVVNGLRNGISREYDDGYLCNVGEKKNNRGLGFSIEYYPNGQIQSISIIYRDRLMYAYTYSEDNKLLEKLDVLECDRDYISSNPDNLFDLVSVSDLEKMNEEILTYGHPLNLPKGFEFVKLDD